MRKSIACLFLLALTAGCGGGSPSGPSATDFSGTWSGTATSNLAPSAPARITLTQSGNSLTGSWSAGVNGGPLTGTVSGNYIAATVTPSDPTTCPFTMNATVSGNRMTGTYTTFNCTAGFSGTIEASKQ